MKSQAKGKLLFLILITLLLTTSCLSFWEGFESSLNSTTSTEEDILTKTYSNDRDKNEIMKVLAFMGIKVRESAIKRVSNWVGGVRYEVKIQKGIGIVYFENYDIVAIRDKSNMNYIYGGATYY